MACPGAEEAVQMRLRLDFGNLAASVNKITPASGLFAADLGDFQNK